MALMNGIGLLIMMYDPFEEYVVDLNSDLLDAMGDGNTAGNPELSKEIAEKLVLWHAVHGSHMFDMPKP